MKRSEAIELLEAYNEYLMEAGYNADVFYEPPTAIDGFMMSKRGKELIPFRDGMKKLDIHIEQLSTPSILSKLINEGKCYGESYKAEDVDEIIRQINEQK